MAKKRKVPASFPFYPDDWLSSIWTRRMKPHERGAYIDLLCIQWNEPDCTITANDDELSRLSGLGDQWAESREVLRSVFVTHPSKPGRIYNKKLYKIRRLIKIFHRAFSDAGRKGGKERQRRLKEARKRGTHTKFEWAFMLDFFSGCAACGSKTEICKDHIIPLIDPRSTDAITNLQPLCHDCNSTKHFETQDFRDDGIFRIHGKHAWELPSFRGNETLAGLWGISSQARTPIKPNQALPLPSSPLPSSSSEEDLNKEKPPPKLKSGSPEALIATEYVRMNPGIIGIEKATPIVAFYLARFRSMEIPLSKAHEAVNDPANQGRLLWEIFNALEPSGKVSRSNGRPDVHDEVKRILAGKGA